LNASRSIATPATAVRIVSTLAINVHLIVPAGAVDERSRQWRQTQKKDRVLIWATNL
jgi:hypothetical protein